MAGDFQVTCIVKRGGHYNPHERIEALGNTVGGWMLSESEIIRRIETGQEFRTASRWKLAVARDAAFRVVLEGIMNMRMIATAQLGRRCLSLAFAYSLR